MSDRPAITAIIPCFNRPVQVRRAIDSVLCQTLPVAELIVVDDGSQTPLSLPEYPGVRLITQRNAGAASARNTGVSAATCDWIAFLDSDDTWAPHKIETQWRLVGTYDAGLCFANMDMASWGTHLDFADWLDTPGIEGPANRAVEIIARGRFVPTSTLLLRKQLFQSLGGYDIKLRVYEDYDLSLRAANRTRTVLTNAVLGEYIRQRDSLGGLTKLPFGIQTEILIMRKVIGDPSYAPKVRRIAQQRIGKLWYDLAYSYREREHRLKSVTASLKSMFYPDAPIASNLRGIAACAGDCLGLSVTAKAHSGAHK